MIGAELRLHVLSNGEHINQFAWSKKAVKSRQNRNKNTRQLRLLLLRNTRLVALSPDI